MSTRAHDGDIWPPERNYHFWRCEETYLGEYKNQRAEFLRSLHILSDLELTRLGDMALIPNWQAYSEREQALEELLRRLDMGLPEGHKRSDVYRRVIAVIRHMGRDLRNSQTQALMGREPIPPIVTPQRVKQGILQDMWE